MYHQSATRASCTLGGIKMIHGYFSSANTGDIEISKLLFSAPGSGGHTPTLAELTHTKQEGRVLPEGLR